MSTPRIEHVNVTVSNPERAATLMEELFGWQVRWKGPARDGGRTIHVGIEGALSRPPHRPRCRLHRRRLRQRPAAEPCRHRGRCGGGEMIPPFMGGALAPLPTSAVVLLRVRDGDRSRARCGALWQRSFLPSLELAGQHPKGLRMLQRLAHCMSLSAILYEIARHAGGQQHRPAALRNLYRCLIAQRSA